MNLKALTLAVAALSTSFAGTALAGGAADHISVADPYVRMAPPGQNVTAAYLVLKNADARDHRLVKADSPAAKVVELHTHISEGGVMKMRPVKDIEIKAKGETALKPGGLHIMLIDVKPMHEGESVPLNLQFEDGSSKKIDATVRKPGAEPMSMSHDMSGMHGHM